MKHFAQGGEASLHYTISDYRIVTSGSYVLCAATGQKIPLSDLKYWSAEYQEAYVDAAAVAAKAQEHGRKTS